jgi:hypothetical protein
VDDGKSDRAYWLHVQAYFASHPPPVSFVIGLTVNVHFRLSDRLNRRSIREIVRRKNAIQAQL